MNGRQLAQDSRPTRKEKAEAMMAYPFALPAVAIGPAFRHDTYFGNDVEWFRADDEDMNVRVDMGFNINEFASWLLFDNRGDCWLITGVLVLPPEGTGWRQRVRAFFKLRRRFRLMVDPLWPVPFEEVRRRVCAAYANRRKLTWEALAIDRKAKDRAEEEAMIDAEVERLAQAKDLPELIDRLQDLADRREAEGH